MMFLKQLALVATAAAMLVLPDTTNANEDGVLRILPVEAELDGVPATATKQNLLIPCVRCPGRAAQLELDFTVVKQERLLVNGFEIFPGPDVRKSSKLSASILSDGGQHSNSQKLGYSLFIGMGGTDEGQNMELIHIELRVIEVGDRFIDGIPAVRVRLIRSPEKGLLIGAIDTDASDEPAPVDDSCDSLWCRVLNKINKTFKDVKSGIKGCGGMRGKMKGGHRKGHNHHGHHGHFEEGKMDNHKGHHKGHGHRRPHHGHGSKGHRQSLGQLVRHFGAFIVFPILLGISAGFGVGILSLAIFGILRRIAVSLRSKCQQDHEAVAAECNATIDKMYQDDEKAGLMAHQEGPPQYEDHPNN